MHYKPHFLNVLIEIPSGIGYLLEFMLINAPYSSSKEKFCSSFSALSGLEWLEIRFFHPKDDFYLMFVEKTFEIFKENLFDLLRSVIPASIMHNTSNLILLQLILYHSIKKFCISIPMHIPINLCLLT